MFSLYMCILIVGFISGVCMETCPEAEDIYPCSCKEDVSREITVTCTSGLFLPLHPLKSLQQSLSKFTGKKDVLLRLEGFNISIPSNFFYGIGIKILEFHSCRIDSFTNDDQPAFLGLDNHLEVLNIVKSSTAPPKLILGHLKKLRSIELSNNDIKELRDDWLGNGLRSLEELYILNNNIVNIGRNAFSKLRNLGTLHLHDNRFGPIQRSMFPDKLAFLSLENNALTSLPVDIFSEMPAIISVSLQRNRITTLDERTWSPIWQQLQRVWLYDNNLVCDDRLKWIHKSKKRPGVGGKCKAPEEFKGKFLEEFFRIRFH